VTPDDPLVRYYLRHSSVMRLATVSGRGRPAVTPLWFVVDRGRLVTSTGASTLAARNAVVEPRVQLLLDAETAGRSRYLLCLGGVAVVRDGLPPLRVLARFATRYYLHPRGLAVELAHVRQWPLRSRYYGQSSAAWIAIEPTSAELVRRPQPHW